MKLTSRDNPKVKRWAKLARDAQLRKKEGRLLIEGPHLVEAALQARTRATRAYWSASRACATRKSRARRGRGRVVLADRVFAARRRRARTRRASPPRIVPSCGEAADGDAVFLEGVQDPGNVGAIMRSAAAFGVAAVTLDRACADALVGEGFARRDGRALRTAGENGFVPRRRAGTVYRPDSLHGPRGGVVLAEADLSRPARLAIRRRRAGRELGGGPAHRSQGHYSNDRWH